MAAAAAAVVVVVASFLDFAGGVISFTAHGRECVNLPSFAGERR